MMMTCILRSLTLIAIASLLTSTGRSVRPVERVPPGTAHISVMTYNLLMTNVAAATTKAIADADPDIVCMQETTDRWDKFLVRLLGARYPHRILGPHADSWNGVSVLSKYPLRDIRRIPAQDQGWFEAVAFTVQTPFGPVQVLNVHLRPMINHHSRVIGYLTVQSIHEREVAALISKLDPGVPTLVVGDFNEGNGGRAVRWLEHNRSMTDALPEFDADTPTWHGPILKLPITSRLDHIIYSPHLHCHEARVITSGASDHYPVAATFSRSAR